MQRAEADNQDRPVKAAGTIRRFTMPAVVLGLLGGHVVFIMVAITLATGDQSFAVVPDYYKKAVDYDQRKAELAESDSLGWRAELQPAALVDALGEREVVVVLRDESGASVTGAAVRVSCYHYARAGEPIAFDLQEVLPGQYVGRARLAREGFWQFELLARQGESAYVREFKQFVNQAEGAR